MIYPRHAVIFPTIMAFMWKVDHFCSLKIPLFMFVLSALIIEHLKHDYVYVY
ncbi:hypothetical protein BD770DRAFT_381026 [Pilaira anomala]|nr:hypothetical protein BD770DRAFT_381026 [Pilaira anomala]